MSEVFAFQPYLRAAEFFAQVGGVVKRGWTSNVVGEKVREFLPERLVFACC